MKFCFYTTATREQIEAVSECTVMEQHDSDDPEFVKDSVVHTSPFKFYTGTVQVTADECSHQDVSNNIPVQWKVFGSSRSAALAFVVHVDNRRNVNAHDLSSSK